MNMTQLRTQTSPFLWGAVAGAVALAFVGFNWGGWVTGGTAEKLAGARADAAILASLVPICVAQFKSSPEARGRLAALQGSEQLGAGRLREQRRLGDDAR